MEREEIIFSVESSEGEKVYKNSFKVYADSLFTSCDKDRAIYWIGHEIFNDIKYFGDVADYKIDSGKKDLNNSFRELFREKRQKALKKQQKPFYNWDNKTGISAGSLIGVLTAICTYFTIGVDCATDTATYLNNVSKNLALFTGLIQSSIAFGIPLLSGGISSFISSNSINWAGKKYITLKNKNSSKTKSHREKLKNDIELYGKLEQAVVD